MSKSIKVAVLLGLIGLAAACARRDEENPVQEFVVLDPEPVTIEPTFKGKFK